MEHPNVDLLISLVVDMKKDIAEIKEKTILNTATLDDHSRRSTASEARLDVQEQKLEKFIEKMEHVSDHVKSVESVAKFSVRGLKILGIIASVAATILALFSHPWRP